MHAVALDPVAPRSAEWHEQRRQGIGSSDAAAIAGLNPWRSPYAVYVEKAEGISLGEENAATEWGLRLEETIAAKFAEDTGHYVWQPAPLAHPVHEWMLANVDRLVAASDHNSGPIGLLEIKTAGAHMRAEWEAGPPDSYVVQVQHQLAVTGLDKAWITALIGGRDYRVYEIARDDELIDTLIAVEAEFWRRVLDRDPPPIDGASSTTDAIRALYDHVQPESEIELPAHAGPLLVEREVAARLVKDAERELERLDNELRALVGDHEIATFGGERVITWKQYVANRLDTKAVKERFPDVAAECTRPSTSRRWLVSGIVE